MSHWLQEFLSHPLNILLPPRPHPSPFSLSTAGMSFCGAKLETGHRADLGYKLPFLQEDRDRNKQIDLWGRGMLRKKSLLKACYQ